MIVMPVKVYVDKSPIHGWGVFAKEKILKEEIIEECAIISLPIQKNERTSLLIDYRFNFPTGTPDWREQVVALGNGSLYNHSDQPNAYWYSIDEKRTFIFVAHRDIEPGEEIFIYYGDINYWNDGRIHTELK